MSLVGRPLSRRYEKDEYLWHREHRPKLNVRRKCDRLRSFMRSKGITMRTINSYRLDNPFMKAWARKILLRDSMTLVPQEQRQKTRERNKRGYDREGSKNLSQ